MSLHPMNDTIFGEVVSEEAFDDLTRLFMEASAAFREQNQQALVLDGQLAAAERQLTAQLDRKDKVNFMCRVIACGPDCRDLKVGDTAILPAYTGTMLTVYDEGQPKRIFAISERKVLARWSDD